MNTEVYVASVARVGDAWRLTIGAHPSHWLGKTTLHAIAGRTITSTATIPISYTITAFEHDSWIEVSYFQADGVTPVTQPVVGKYTLPKLTFLAGTPRMTDTELAEKEVRTYEGVMPLLWLCEIMQEKVSYDDRKAFISPLSRIFCLDNTTDTQWTSEDHLELAVQPMRNYADRLVQNLIMSGLAFVPKGDAIYVNQSKFGLAFRNPKSDDTLSHMKNLFGEKLSGIEMRLEIPIKRKCYDS